MSYLDCAHPVAFFVDDHISELEFFQRYLSELKQVPLCDLQLLMADTLQEIANTTACISTLFLGWDFSG